MCSVWDLDQELASYNENVISSDIKIKISLSVIIACPFNEKGHIAEKDERDKKELRKWKNPNWWLFHLILKVSGWPKWVWGLIHHTMYFHYQNSFISPPLNISPKNQSRKLFGLLEVGNVTLSIKFIAQEGWGHLGMACLRKAKMIVFSPKILTTFQIVIKLCINIELLRQK